MYKVYLPNNFRGERYGLQFLNGESSTVNEWLAKHLSSCGVRVEREGGDDTLSKPRKQDTSAKEMTGEKAEPIDASPRGPGRPKKASE